MAKFGERLKSARGEMTQKQLADLLGVSMSSVQNWENGRNEPDRAAIDGMRKIFGCSLEWLVSGVGEPYPELSEDFYYIPMYRQPVSAGQGALVIDEDVGRPFAFRADWVQMHLRAQAANLFLLHVVGDSMEPVIQSGDMILVDKGHLAIIDGSVYVVSTGESIVVKRATIQNGDVVLSSFNAAYPSFRLDRSEGSKHRIIGRVRWLGRRYD